LVADFLILEELGCILSESVLERKKVKKNSIRLLYAAFENPTHFFLIRRVGDVTNV
jgi:hypothetical protein